MPNASARVAMARPSSPVSNRLPIHAAPKQEGTALAALEAAAPSGTSLSTGVTTYGELEPDIFAPHRLTILQLGDSHTVDIPTLATISDTALTRDVAIAMGEDGLPNTFVPGRNLLFFTFAAAVAWRRNIRHMVGGMCETDYSGYPDCRDNTLKSLQVAISLGLEKAMTIDTPLMWLDKADTWAMTERLGGEPLISTPDAFGAMIAAETEKWEKVVKFAGMKPG